MKKRQAIIRQISGSVTHIKMALLKNLIFYSYKRFHVFVLLINFVRFLNLLTIRCTPQIDSRQLDISFITLQIMCSSK